MADPTEILTRVEGARRLEFWEQHPPDVGLVYLVQGERRAPVKVGHAKNVRRRVRELQTGNHALLHVLDVVPGGKAVEATLHQQLAEHRLVGEWFKWNEALTAWLTFRILAEQMVAVYMATSKVPDIEDFEAWQTLRQFGQPEIPQSIPGQQLDFTPTVRDRYRRQWISANPECNQMRHLGF